MKKYHMNKSEREMTDNKEIEGILKSGKYVTISMCRDNEPYIVTLSYGYDQSDNSLYFHTSLKGLKLDFIRDNPIVCATVIDDGGYLMNECSHAYRSVVFWGNMIILDSLDEKKHGMEVLLNHLEDIPIPIKERTLKNDQVYKNIAVLKLQITQISGKNGK